MDRYLCIYALYSFIRGSCSKQADLWYLHGSALQPGLYFCLQTVEDEIEASIREVNEILGELPVNPALLAGYNAESADVGATLQPLLTIEHKYVNLLALWTVINVSHSWWDQELEFSMFIKLTDLFYIFSVLITVIIFHLVLKAVLKNCCQILSQVTVTILDI